MLRSQSAHLRWAQASVEDLLKTLQLNVKLKQLGICPKLLKDMNSVDYREYTRIVEALLKRSA